MKVHSRGKKIEKGVDYNRIARATAGYTGAELMNLMNTAAIVTVRRGARVITEGDIFQVFSKASISAPLRPDLCCCSCCVLRLVARNLKHVLPGSVRSTT